MKYKHTNTHAYFDLFNRLYILRSEYSLVSECMCAMRTDTPQQLSNGFNSTPSSSLSFSITISQRNHLILCLQSSAVLILYLVPHGLNLLNRSYLLQNCLQVRNL